MARALVVLALLLAVLPARAETPRERARAAAPRPSPSGARAPSHDRQAHAVRRLARALSRSPDVALLLRYAELALPWTGLDASAQRARLAAHAPAYLAALERADFVESDLESARAALLHGAFAHLLLGHHDDAFALVRQAGRLQDPATVRCLRAMAALAAHRDELATAGRALALAQQYMPQDLAVMSEFGRVLLARGRADEAAALFGQRFAIEPESLEARRDYAYALLSAGRAADALALLRAADEACRELAGCALEAARTALEAERPDLARTYARARLAHGESIDALFVMADAHLREGQLGEARAAYLAVLRIDPRSLRAKQALESLSEPPGASP